MWLVKCIRGGLINFGACLQLYYNKVTWRAKSKSKGPQDRNKQEQKARKREIGSQMEDMGTAYFVYMLRGPSMLAIKSNMAALTFQIILHVHCFQIYHFTHVPTDRAGCTER
jgi:hypothetical protein